MHALLERINTIPGILGSMRCDETGKPVTHALPPEQLDADLRGAAQAAADSLRALGDAAGAPIHLDLHCGDRRVLVVPTAGGPVVLLCDKSVNPRTVVPRVTDLVRAADAQAAQRAGGAPAPAPARPRPPLDDLLGPAPAAAEPAPGPARAERSAAAAAVVAAAAASPPAATHRVPLPALAALGAAVLALAGGLAWWAASRPPGDARPTPRATAGAPAQASAPARAPTVVLRLGGAKSFAAELAPALARGYFESLALEDVKVERPDPNHATVSGARDGVRVAITVEGLNTPDGFDQLAAGKLDLAMSGRRIKPEWQAKLDAHGSMMVPGREHVVALSGIAVIVNPANPIAQLTRDQLAAIFTGAVTDWSAVGGRKGPIRVYAGDEKLGVTDLFRTLVLQKREYGAAVKRLALLPELSDQVALDPQGIAYVTLPFVRSARAVPLAEGDSVALVPNAFTLATEDYPLTHRLFFYVLPRPDAPHLLTFLQFALGPAGQALVKRSGFVELSVATAPRDPPQGAPPRYVKLTRDAHRLSSTFRFEPGASEFDVRALADLERVSGYLVESRLNGEAIRVLGFADAQGKREVNQGLSEARATQVARAFAQRGITGVRVEGFGSALPVATNGTADGRERNRRVEIWIAR